MWIRIIFVALAFMVEIISGIWTKQAGKPYPVSLFAAHKLVAVGLIVFFAVNAFSSLSAFACLVVSIVSILLIAMVVTGGWMSVTEDYPEIVSKAHRVFAYLILPLAGLGLFLLRSHP